MSLFKRDPAKRAERLRRRAARKEARAAARRAQATALAPDEEPAQVVGRDGQGRPVVQDVQIRKTGSKQRNARIQALEEDNEAHMERIQALEEDLKEAETRLEEIEALLEKRNTGSMLLSKATLGAANAMLTFININDQVQNRGALVLSEALDALTDMDALEPAQQQWARAGRVLSKAWAYYDPEEGFGSVLAADKEPPSAPPKTGKG